LKVVSWRLGSITVDGSEILLNYSLRLVFSSHSSEILENIPGGAGFLNHEQYVFKEMK